MTSTKRWLILAALVALAIGGCKKDAPEPATEQEPAAAEAAKATPVEPAAAAPKAEEKAPAEPTEPATPTVSDETLDKLVAHLEALTKVLEENAEDTAKAAAAVSALVDEKKAEIAAVRELVDGTFQKLSPAEQQRLGARLYAKLGPVMKRLTKVFADHPELSTDPAIQKALGPIIK